MMDRFHDNLGYWCRDAAKRFPDKAALIDLSGGRERPYRYRDLDERLDRMAAWCVAAGLGPGDRLAVAIGNRLEFLDAQFGPMRAGVVTVPLNTRQGADTLAYILADAGCRAAIVDPDCHPAIVSIVEQAGITARLAVGRVPPGWQDLEDALAAQTLPFDPPSLPADHPSFQPYTSGSTGRPKGVVLTHAGQLWWIRATQKYWPATPEARALAAVPLYHKNAMAGAIKPLLLIGGSVVLLEGFEPRRFLETLAAYRCTRTGAVPTVFTRLLQQHDLLEKLDFSALQSISIGSAPVQEELIRAVERTFGCPVRESYGLTEGGPVMIGPPRDGRPSPPGSCGVAWPEGEVKLLDAEGREHPSDGELWVRNPGVTPGYYNLPEVNAKRLKDGWLATGDLFHRDPEGFFYFRGRTDDMFNTGGENVYPKEVENLLIGHPEIYDACVVPVSDPDKGAVPVAMVMPEPGSRLTEDDVKAYALANGPAYAHPRRVRFVEQMPLSGAGKVDRMAIGRLLEEAFGGKARTAAPAPAIAPAAAANDVDPGTGGPG